MNRLFDRHRTRIDIVITVLSVLFLVLLLNLFRLQILNHEQFAETARGKSRDWVEISGERGTIYDRNYEILTCNITHYTFWVNTCNPYDRKEIINLFSKEFSREKSYYNRLLVENKGYICLEKNIPEPDCKNILANISLRGLNENHFDQRFYPFPDIASQVLGYTQGCKTGIIGIENYYNKLLQGECGKKELIRTGSGFRFTAAQNPAPVMQDGTNLQLTLDIQFQAILHDELLAALEKTNAESANGIIVDPYTGRILAMSSVPSLDLNEYSQYPVANQMNRTIGLSYEPGSTFKIVTIAAALESQRVTPWQIYDCEDGEHTSGRRTIHDHEPHGELTVSEIMAYSSNIGVSKIADVIGPNIMYEFARDFGFGRSTGVELPFESPGFLEQYSNWSDFSCASIAMGQEISATTLQIAMAYSAIANGGFLLKPTIVQQIYNEEPAEFQPQVIRQVVQTETAREVLTMLRAVVEYGTASKAKIPGFDVAGKTGTAQKCVNGKYSDRDYISSFAGIFPANAPRYVCVVSVDSPSYGFHWGNETAAPVVRKVFERIISLGREPLLRSDNELIVDSSGRKTRGKEIRGRF